MTMEARFLWTKEQYTLGTGTDVVFRATNSMVAPSVRWTNGPVLTILFLLIGTQVRFIGV